jgi:hypothetical protein
LRILEGETPNVPLYKPEAQARGGTAAVPPRSRFGLVFPDVFQLAVQLTAQLRNCKG